METICQDCNKVLIKSDGTRIRDPYFGSGIKSCRRDNTATIWARCKECHDKAITQACLNINGGNVIINDAGDTSSNT